MQVPFYWRFTGLCLFVPKYDIYGRCYEEPGTKNEDSDSHRYHGNQMRVLLVDALGPGYSYSSTGSHSHGGELHEPHVPVLVCSYDSVDREDKLYRQPDAVFYPTDALMRQTGERLAIFYLDDQELYRADAKPCSLRIKHYNNTGSGCAPLYKELQYNSFAWVAPLAKIAPGSETIRDECFADQAYEYVDPAVSARVSLTQGEVGTFRMAQDATFNVLRWGFRVPGKPSQIRHTQSLADIVELEDDTYDDKKSHYVDLTTALIRHPRNLRVYEIYSPEYYKPLTIRLRYIPPDNQLSERGIVAWVQNMPWLDILGTRYGRPPLHRPPDVHFAHFYNLSYYYEEANVPHALARCRLDDPKHQGNPFCPPSQGGANPLA